MGAICFANAQNCFATGEEVEITVAQPACELPAASESEFALLDISKSIAAFEASSPQHANMNEAYFARRKQKLMARKQTCVQPIKNEWLSNIHEVDEDVQYRFSLVVKGLLQTKTGAVETQVVAAACASSNVSLGSSSPTRLPGGAKGEETAGKPRCLCEVPYPSNPDRVGADSTKSKLAKLVFTSLGISENIPDVSGVLEAQATAVVFVLVTDPPMGDTSEPWPYNQQQTCQRQLQVLEQHISDSRERVLASHRPVRAVILCRIGGSDEDVGWRRTLEEFEGRVGRLWKFGPLELSDGGALYAAFAEIASERILMVQNDQDDPHKSEEGLGSIDETSTVFSPNGDEENSPRGIRHGFSASRLLPRSSA